MVYSARVTVKILNTHHCCRLPLVQVGLEISVQVIVKMDYSPQNEDVIFKYKSLLTQIDREAGKYKPAAEAKPEHETEHD